MSLKLSQWDPFGNRRLGLLLPGWWPILTQFTKAIISKHLIHFKLNHFTNSKEIKKNNISSLLPGDNYHITTQSKTKTNENKNKTTKQSFILSNRIFHIKKTLFLEKSSDMRHNSVFMRNLYFFFNPFYGKEKI